MRKKNRAKRLVAGQDASSGEMPDILRSTAEECIQAAEKSKYRTIRSELLQLAETYIERARLRESRAAHTSR